MSQESRQELQIRFASTAEGEKVDLCLLLFASLVAEADLVDIAVARAHAQGLDTEMACEVVLQSFLFAGFPRCINGLEAFRRHFGQGVGIESREVADSAQLRQRGRALFAKIYGDNTKVVLEALNSYHVELQNWILEDAYGKILSRPGLPPKIRELCAVAGLLVSGDTRQLSSHIRGAKNCGASANELTRAVKLIDFLVDAENLELALTLIAKIV